MHAIVGDPDAVVDDEVEDDIADQVNANRVESANGWLDMVATQVPQTRIK